MIPDPPVKSTAPQSVPLDDSHLLSRLHRLTLDQYEAMIRHGIITDDDKNIEFLNGFIIEKGVKSQLHIVASLLLSQAISKWISKDWSLLTQSAIRVIDSMPEPDLCVLRGNPRQYTSRRPGASDTPVIVEIADSSLLVDRIDKLRLYARAGIPTYWIINVQDNQIEVFTQPATDDKGVSAYASQTTHKTGESIPLLLDGTVVAAVPVSELLP